MAKELSGITETRRRRKNKDLKVEVERKKESSKNIYGYKKRLGENEIS